MGLAIRYLVVTESGRLVRIPAAWIERAWNGEPVLTEYAGHRLNYFQVVVEVDRRRTLEVVSVSPLRLTVGAHGEVDAQAEMARGLGYAWCKGTTIDDAIAKLQHEANHFWEPTRAEWNQAAAILGVSADDLQAARLPLPRSRTH